MFFLIDEDNDKIPLSTYEDFAIFTAQNKSVKKLFVKVQDMNTNTTDCHYYPWQSMIYCNECERQIEGPIYKCLICDDYDLCNTCDKNAVHFEHPMLKIPSAQVFVSKLHHDSIFSY